MLVNWRDTIINLDEIQNVIVAHRADNNQKWVIKIYFKDGTILQTSCNTEDIMMSSFEELIGIIQKATNLSLDKNGKFVCSHCGAPNS